jgi:hypothetical protein
MPARFGLDKETTHYNPATGVTTLTPGPDGVIDFNYSQAYVNPTSWELDLNAAGSSGGKLGLRPSRIVDYTFFVDGVKYDNGASPSIAVQVPQLGAHTVTIVVTAADGLKAMSSQQVVMKDYVIVSLGDSAASGQGNPDKPAVYNARGKLMSAPVWENQRTEDSGKSGPAQAALALEQSSPHSSVTFLSFAASGATILNGLLGPQDGDNPPTNPNHALLPSQLDQLMQVLYPNGTAPSAHPRTIDALTISIGLNDIGFANILEAAADPLAPPIYLNPKLVSQLESGLAQLPGLYDEVGAAIRSNLGNLVSNVDLTEYPDPIHNATGGFSAGSGTLFGISAAEFAYAYNNGAVPLQNVMKAAAARNGWTYVGGIAADTRDHGLTAGPGPNGSWFLTPVQSFVIQRDFNGTIHPNAQGQLVLRDHILGALLAEGL